MRRRELRTTPTAVAVAEAQVRVLARRCFESSGMRRRELRTTTTVAAARWLWSSGMRRRELRTTPTATSDSPTRRFRSFRFRLCFAHSFRRSSESGSAGFPSLFFLFCVRLRCPPASAVEARRLFATYQGLLLRRRRQRIVRMRSRSLWIRFFSVEIGTTEPHSQVSAARPRGRETA